MTIACIVAFGGLSESFANPSPNEPASTQPSAIDLSNYLKKTPSGSPFSRTGSSDIIPTGRGENVRHVVLQRVESTPPAESSTLVLPPLPEQALSTDTRPSFGSEQPEVTPSTTVAPPHAPLASGSFVSHVEYEGTIRRYLVYVPSCVVTGGSLPLVVALHGSGDTPESFLEYTGWAAMAEASGFIVLAPEGFPLITWAGKIPVISPQVWNSGQYSEIRPRSHLDDVGLINGIMDQVAAQWPVDPHRVYAVGYSNGGAMTFRLASECADRFTAIASVAGLCCVKAPQPCRPIPTMLIVGTLDPIVPYLGGLKVLPWQISLSPPVFLAASKWAGAIGCTLGPVEHPQELAPGVGILDYTAPGCPGVLLRVLRVQLQGHGWPSGQGLRLERLLGPDSSTLNATGQIWAFFSQYHG